MTDEQEIREAIGKRLRALRLLNGKTQQEIASTIGLSAQQWQKYEKGVNTISSTRFVHHKWCYASCNP